MLVKQKQTHRENSIQLSSRVWLASQLDWCRWCYCYCPTGKSRKTQRLVLSHNTQALPTRILTIVSSSLLFLSAGTYLFVHNRSLTLRTVLRETHTHNKITPQMSPMRVLWHMQKEEHRKDFGKNTEERRQRKGRKNERECCRYNIQENVDIRRREKLTWCGTVGIVSWSHRPVTLIMACLADRIVYRAHTDALYSTKAFSGSVYASLRRHKLDSLSFESYAQLNLKASAMHEMTCSLVDEPEPFVSLSNVSLAIPKMQHVQKLCYN